jgi:hypothetical protein
MCGRVSLRLRQPVFCAFLRRGAGAASAEIKAGVIKAADWDRDWKLGISTDRGSDPGVADPAHGSPPVVMQKNAWNATERLCPELDLSLRWA